MPLPFDNWTLERANEALDEVLYEDAEANQLFVEGDHWQNTDGWIGPIPAESDADSATTFQLFESGFVSENVVKEVVDRHAGGVVGQEPVWGFTLRRPMKADEKPTDAEQAQIDEVEAALTEWWNDRGVHEVLRRAVARSLWAQHGPVRVYIPVGRLRTEVDNEGRATPTVGKIADLPQALRMISIELPATLRAAVYTDPMTEVEVGIINYTVTDEEGKEIEFIELSYVQPPESEQEGAGLTVIRVIGSDGTDTRHTFNLDGTATIQSITREPLITPQVIQNQRALNLACTLVPKNLADAAFLERTFLNARMPGHMVETPIPGVPGQTQKRWVPEDYLTGPGAVNFVTGIDWTDDEGKQHLAQPTLQYRDPVPIKPLLDARLLHYTSILQETKQTHILMNEDGRASGTSREQARVDYNISLNSSKDVTERVGRRILTAALAMAETLLGKPGQYTSNLRPYFECRIDLGPVSVTERQQNSSDVKQGLMASETAMARSGVLDVDKEMAVIASQSDHRLARAERYAEVFSKMVPAGVPFELIGQWLGLPPTDITSLISAEQERKRQAEELANSRTAPNPDEPSTPPPSQGE